MVKVFTTHPIHNVCCTVHVPADKSISHRALILASLCKRRTRIIPVLLSDDTRATRRILTKLGAAITPTHGGGVEVTGCGMFFPRKRPVRLFASESGTTMRIISGLLCTQRFPVIFDAGRSLRRRPMARIITPLAALGAHINGTKRRMRGSRDVYPPLTILPATKLSGRTLTLPVASAQVKSALMLAALYADKKSVIREPYPSRDHTERMLKLFKARVRKKGNAITVFPTRKLVSPGKLAVPADFSSAAFFIVLGLLAKQTKLTVEAVNSNPTRTGLLAVLKRMGARITLKKRCTGFEPTVDITAQSSTLTATVVRRREIPLLIDEIPILCVAAGFARGTTVIEGVEELTLKETDRVTSMVHNLKKAGIRIYSRKTRNGLALFIKGGSALRRKCTFQSFGDHRTAMSMIVFGAASDTQHAIDDIRCINKSFPEFTRLVSQLSKRT